MSAAGTPAAVGASHTGIIGPRTAALQAGVARMHSDAITSGGPAAKRDPRRGTAARLVWIEPVEYSDVMTRTPSTPMTSWTRARPLRLTEVGSQSRSARPWNTRYIVSRTVKAANSLVLRPRHHPVRPPHAGSDRRVPGLRLPRADHRSHRPGRHHIDTRHRADVRGGWRRLARERRVYELVPDSSRMAGRSKPRKASGVTKAVISWICAPRRVSTSMARGVKVCVLSFQA